MDLELSQVKLRLSKRKDVIQQLKDNKALRKDESGTYFPIQFDSLHFKFYEGQTVIVGKSVADSLIASSYIVVGPDHLGGPMHSALEKVGTFSLGEAESEEAKTQKTRCPLCDKDCMTFPRLARHLMTAHKKDRPDLYQQDSTDWKTPVEEPVGADAE